MTNWLSATAEFCPLGIRHFLPLQRFNVFNAAEPTLTSEPI